MPYSVHVYARSITIEDCGRTILRFEDGEGAQTLGLRLLDAAEEFAYNLTAKDGVDLRGVGVVATALKKKEKKDGKNGYHW